MHLNVCVALPILSITDHSELTFCASFLCTGSLLLPPLYESLLTNSVQSVSPAIRWSISRSSPAYHPLPRVYPYPRLRNTRAFQAVDLLFNEFRHINIAPFQGPLQPSTRTWAYHFRRVVQYSLILTTSTYPASVLAKKSLEPSLLVRVYLAAILGAGFYLMISIAHHAVACIGVLSGVWLPEEWPDIMDRPWLADSVNDLWGKRYHQGLRVSLAPFPDPLTSYHASSQA